MVNDGELCRREAGYEHMSMLEENAISLRMSPLEYELLREKVVHAINLAYTREVEDDGEIDLGLMELNEKKADARD